MIGFTAKGASSSARRQKGGRALNPERAKILAQSDTRRKADDAGKGVDTMSAQQLAESTRKALDYWGRVVHSAQITAE